MNNFELAEYNEKMFNHFLKVTELYENGAPMVEFSRVQEYETLSGEITTSTKKVRKILEKNLQQKPTRKKNHGHDIWSFKLKGLGWIIIEKFNDNSYMTLKNKWW